jgi:cystathionine beta-lyase/cystathionine gamma-synthase
MTDKERWSLETQLIHGGEPRPRIAGSVNFPIFQSSTYEFAGEGTYHDVRYMRCSNTPNQVMLGDKLALLEGGEAGLVTGSGMAAISATLLSMLSAGDHMLAHRTLYGGTNDFIVQDLPKMGVQSTFVDADDASSWEQALRPTTRLFYIETMTNPLLEVVDLRGVVEFCRAHKLVAIIDNTCASPVNYRPIEAGFDVVVHSATKYLNGHSDIVAGAVVGKKDRILAVKKKLDHFGGSLDAHACFLLHRGLKTLSMRVRHQNESALGLARFLERHPKVGAVHYPGLESHPRHSRAREWFRGAGGLLSFELRGGVPAVETLIKSLHLTVDAPSLGGPESLLTRPCLTSHGGLTAEARRERGIGDNLVRISVGFEGAADLVDDFSKALARITN